MNTRAGLLISIGLHVGVISALVVWSALGPAPVTTPSPVQTTSKPLMIRLADSPPRVSPPAQSAPAESVISLPGPGPVGRRPAKSSLASPLPQIAQEQGTPATRPPTSDLTERSSAEATSWQRTPSAARSPSRRASILPPATAGRVEIEAALLSEVSPRYPRSCRRRGHEGVVELALSIDATGRVTSATVVTKSSCPELDQAAREAALALRYEPARRGGTPLESVTRLQIRFQLQ